jgi:alkaline phosphatase D
MNRRAFVRKSALGGFGLIASQSEAVSSLQVSANPFTLGVASGDPTPDGFVLWTRLAPDPLNGGGMPSLPILVRWRVAADHELQHVVQQSIAVAWPSLAHSVHVEVGGLAPDRWYFYQFAIGDAESPVGRTRTLPSAGTHVDRLRFGFVSCQDWQNGLYPAYRNLAQDDLDFVVHLGDYIYEYASDPGAVRQHDGPEAQTLQGYRNRHALYKTDPHLQAAHLTCPWLVVPDDHEVENNYANDISENNDDRSWFLQRRAAAYRAYYEHMPLRLRSFPTGPSMSLYRGLDFGDLASFSALDTRQYRTDQPCGDGPRLPCADEFSPAQTMTGPDQERWLLSRLNESHARWNVIAQQTMFASFDFLSGPNAIFLMDQWDGYWAARQRITSFLALRRPANPIVITGDIHSSWVHDVKANYLNPSSATVGVEFVGPSISSGFPSILIPIVEAALPANPHTVFFDGLYHGYVRCTITPEQWLAEYRVVPTILDDRAEAFTLRSFVVQDGLPGAILA